MLEVKNYFIDDEENLWANIYSNGRRQWCAVANPDGDNLFYTTIEELDNKDYEVALRKLTEYCCQHGYERTLSELPHIEDTSKPMQEAWNGADEWDGPFTNLGYYVNDEQFKEDYGMTVAEFKQQLQADIDKYGISTEIEERYNEDFLYSVTWWLCEYFTAKA